VFARNRRLPSGRKKKKKRGKKKRPPSSFGSLQAHGPPGRGPEKEKRPPIHSKSVAAPDFLAKRKEKNGGKAGGQTGNKNSDSLTVNHRTRKEKGGRRGGRDVTRGDPTVVLLVRRREGGEGKKEENIVSDRITGASSANDLCSQRWEGEEEEEGKGEGGRKSDSILSDPSLVFKPHLLPAHRRKRKKEKGGEKKGEGREGKGIGTRRAPIF